MGGKKWEEGDGEYWRNLACLYTIGNRTPVLAQTKEPNIRKNGDLRFEKKMPIPANFPAEILNLQSCRFARVAPCVLLMVLRAYSYPGIVSSVIWRPIVRR